MLTTAGIVRSAMRLKSVRLPRRADGSGRGDCGRAAPGDLGAGLGGVAKLARHEQAGGEARDQDQCEVNRPFMTTSASSAT